MIAEAARLINDITYRYSAINFVYSTVPQTELNCDPREFLFISISTITSAFAKHLVHMELFAVPRTRPPLKSMEVTA